MLQKLFGFDASTMTVRKEVMGGITSFLTMAYILAVNPMILSAAGMDQNAVFTSTAVSAIIATLIMAIYAKLPFALAPGMGLNAFFAYTVCVCAISGVFFRYIIKRKSFPMILLSVFVSHVVGSVGVKTYGLSLYGIPAQVLLLRIPLYICIAAAESYLLWLLLRNKTISSFGGDIK